MNNYERIEKTIKVIKNKSEKIMLTTTNVES